MRESSLRHEDQFISDLVDESKQLRSEPKWRDPKPLA